MKASKYQRLNNAGVDLLELGRYNDARKCFVAALEALKKDKVVNTKRWGTTESTMEAFWSSASNRASRESDDSVFVWSRGLRLILPTSPRTRDMASLMATLTFNSALCLHMTSSQSNPESVRWVIRVYKVVLKLLQRTQNKLLSERMKIAVFNNLASLHCQLLDYCEAYTWYGLLSRHLKTTNWLNDIIAPDRAGIIANLMFCCRPHVAGAA
mmetsp:Transcript_5482/g.9039  ORF Transcript_5482/g.9039 Transcript_5482/m.9039 type:complete len:212 (-) Transcript_5482:960-1595(-)